MPLKQPYPAADAPVYLAKKIKVRGKEKLLLSVTTLPFRDALTLRRRLNLGRKHPQAHIVSTLGQVIPVPPGMRPR